MRERNARCVVYDKYVCMKAILARLNRVADIPAITAQAWTEQGAAAIERWREGYKLLYYRPALDPIAHFPECDALLFIECPLQYDMFEKLADTPTLVIGTHFAGATAGRIVRDGAAYRLDV